MFSVVRPAAKLMLEPTLVEPALIIWVAPVEVPRLTVLAMAVAPIAPIEMVLALVVPTKMVPVLAAWREMAAAPVPPLIRVVVAAVVLPRPIVVAVAVVARLR